MKLYKDSERQQTIRNFLKMHGVTSLERMKSGFRKERRSLPFAKTGDKAVHDWLKTINGVKHRKSNGVTEYYLEDDEKEMDTATPIGSPEKKERRSWKSEQDYELKRPKLNNFVNKKTEADNIAPHLYNFQLVGDEHLLNIALFDLGFEKNKNEKIRQSGTCVSGLRIAEAAKLARKMNSEVTHSVIINVGSVDVAEGRQLVQMICDYKKMIEAFEQMSIQPVLTTLAPMPNYLLGNRKETLNGFNDFIRVTVGQHFPVIDLNKCMLADRDIGKIDLNLYQPNPRHNSGSRKAMLMWNKLGRIRIRKMLIKNIGAALVYKNFVGDYF